MAYVYDHKKKEYVQRVIAEISNVNEIGGGGGSTMRFLFGETNPTANDGQPGDVFLNTETGDIFINNNGTWSNQGNLKGPKGDKGDQGDEGPQGPPGIDAEPQFTPEQVTALLSLIENDTE